jgi:PAS domain S-box-containing protein
MQTEEDLRKREEKYRTFFENSADAMMTVCNGKFASCNAACVALFGYENEEEILGTSPWALSPEYQPDGKKSQGKAIEMMEIATTQGSHRFEWEHKRKNGDALPVEVTLTAVPSESENVLHAVCRDISERKQAEEEREKLEAQLRQAQKMEAIGQLAGGVAHDFNNLLQVIIGYGEMLVLVAGTDGRIGDQIDEVMKAANRATTLVQQLLAFSRRQVLKLEVLDLKEIVEDLAKMIRRVIGEHIAFSIHSEPGPNVIYADRGQVEQILMNLCVNARDAMPEGGKLTIRTENTELSPKFCLNHPEIKPGVYALLSVCDTGEGMDEEVQRHIFEPFFSTKGEGKGTGLGLSTVYGLVRQHQGMIGVESKRGLGSTFKIYLPLSESLEEVARVSKAAVPAGGTEVILLAEDEESVRNLAERFLETAGYTVLTAADGEEAIRLFDEHAEKIGLALLDVVMPRGGGRAVFEHIREKGAQTPVLFVSGYSASGVHSNFIIEDDLEIIPKPYQREQLLRTVRQLIDKAKVQL